MHSMDFKPDFPSETVSEGMVKVVVPRLTAYVNMPCEHAPSKAPVFYNPVMEMNRDIAVLALEAFQTLIDRRLRVCEPLAATGLRGIRFAAEIGGIEKVLMGDINQQAFELARYNIELNGQTSKVEVKRKEANCLLALYSVPRKRFDYVDIDPFGSPVRFLDSAVRALRDGGLLAVTATDMAPLCGVHPRACIRKYGGKPLRSEYCHELAVRLVAGSLATAAAKHDIGIDVVFAHQAEHYARVYAIIRHGATHADGSLRNMGYILHCFKCLNRKILTGLYPIRIDETCSECGSKMTLGGPMWIGKLFNREFCGLMKECLNHRKLKLGQQIRKILTLAESESDAPALYFVIDKLCEVLRIPVPSVKDVQKAVTSKGVEASLTIFHTRGLKSDLPVSGIKEIVRVLARAPPKHDQH